MTIRLPYIITDFFEADRQKRGDAVVACFTENATVRDDGHTYVGWHAIRQWKTESSRKYSYSVEPRSISTKGDRTVVVSHLVGDFPGSPVDLRYQFVLDGNKIAGLEITL